MKSPFTLLLVILIHISCYAQQMATISVSAGTTDLTLQEEKCYNTMNMTNKGKVVNIQLGIPISKGCQMIATISKAEYQVNEQLVQVRYEAFDKWKDAHWSAQTFSIGMLGTAAITKDFDADLYFQFGTASLSPDMLDFSYRYFDRKYFNQISIDPFNTNFFGFGVGLKWNFNKSLFIKTGLGIQHLLETGLKKTEVETVYTSSIPDTWSNTEYLKIGADIVNLTFGVGVNLTK